MRVLFVTNYFPPDEVGGAEIAAFHSCHGLIAHGLDASVLTVNTRTSQREDTHYRLQGVPVHKISHRPFTVSNALTQTFDPRVYRDVLAELRQVQPDLVHIHNVSGATLAPFVACHRLGVPVVLTLHDLWLLCPNNMLYQHDGVLCSPAEHPNGCRRCFRRYDYWADLPQRRQIFSFLVRHVGFFMSPSQKLIDLHVAAGYDPNRFRLVRYGIVPGLAQPPARSPAREIVQERGLYNSLLFAGSVVEIKGMQTVIEALPLLFRYLPRFRLVVAGSGDERFLTALRKFDSSRVVLLGRVPFREMRALYSAADLTAVPSTWYDNSPMVIYESLLAGTPIVGSKIGGIPELIEEGETGYTVPPRDVAALAEKVIEYFALPAPRRRAMRRSCTQHAREQLTLERHLDRLQEVYKEVVQV
jgi:glycosyltransferase involved in cell wall biosynthesis